MAKALFINLTMDACKLKQMKQSMVTITAHWIEDWTMQSAVLCVSLAFGTFILLLVVFQILNRITYWREYCRTLYQNDGVLRYCWEGSWGHLR